ncbi:MAG: hypothetical protein ACXABY_16455 [Candidatus Thorarchaeota archaeon]|jgi:hypothetical protein
MTIRKLTKADKDNLNHDANEYSDLSMWLTLCLGACSAGEYTGKKVTRKNWNAQDTESKQFVVFALLNEPTDETGLSKKDREKLWRTVRSAKVREARKELKSWNLSAAQHEKISSLLDRLDRVGLFSALKGGTTADKLNDAIYAARDEFEAYSSGFTASPRNQKIRQYLYTLSCLTEVEVENPPNSKEFGKLVVKLARKAMRNVGLRPDATSVYEPQKEAALPLAA